MQINSKGLEIFGIVLTIVMLGLLTNVSLVSISFAVETVTLDLTDGRENTFNEGTTVYEEVSNIQTNSSQLQGIEAGDGYTYNSVADDSINLSFPAKIPDPNNPNRVNVVDASIWLDVNSIETKDNGLNIFYGEAGFMPSKIGDDVSIASGIIEETSDDEAKATLTLS